MEGDWDAPSSDAVEHINLLSQPTVREQSGSEPGADVVIDLDFTNSESSNINIQAVNENGNEIRLTSEERRQIMDEVSRRILDSAVNGVLHNELPTSPDALRTEFHRLRQTINHNESAQNICTMFTALLPFLFIFLIKFFFDFASDLAEIFGSVLLFLFLDYHVQKFAMRQQGWTRYLCVNTAIGLHHIVLQAILVYMVYTYVIALEIHSLVLRGLYDVGPTLGYAVKTVLITDSFVKTLTVFGKLIIVYANEGVISSSRKRRAYQVVEYTSLVARCIVPIPVWALFFVGPIAIEYPVFYDFILAAAYCAFKAREILIFAKYLWNSIVNAIRGISYGKILSKNSINSEEKCSVCLDDFTSPVELTCNHIFCNSCICRWLETNNSCPQCRKQVENGDDRFTTCATTKGFAFV